jgi:hypothetical protein
MVYPFKVPYYPQKTGHMPQWMLEDLGLPVSYFPPHIIQAPEGILPLGRKGEACLIATFCKLRPLSQDYL